MKKIIVAVAGLMISGSFVSASHAAVEFSGDARARYYFGDNYSKTGSGSGDHWNSRVRLHIKGTTEGGAYAVARLRMDTDPWGSTGNISDNAGGDVDVYEAYIAVPLGDFLVSAGRQNLSITSGFFDDLYLDNARVSWSSANTTVTGFYGIVDSEEYSDGSYNDDENRLYGVVVNQGIGEWNITGAVAYAEFDLKEAVDRESGLLATIAADGKIGPVAVAAEFGMQEDGIAAADSKYIVEETGDTGFGGYASAGMDFDAFNVTALGGFTSDGYVLDEPVGFIMIGGDNQITPGKLSHLGNYGDQAVDTLFVGVKTSYMATENLNVNFNLAYANIEAIEGDLTDFNGQNSADAFEVSAELGYQISEGTMVYARAGYMDIDVEEDPTIGAGVSLELAF